MITYMECIKISPIIVVYIGQVFLRQTASLERIKSLLPILIAYPSEYVITVASIKSLLTSNNGRFRKRHLIPPRAEKEDGAISIIPAEKALLSRRLSRGEKWEIIRGKTGEKPAARGWKTSAGVLPIQRFFVPDPPPFYGKQRNPPQRNSTAP